MKKSLCVMMISVLLSIVVFSCDSECGNGFTTTTTILYNIEYKNLNGADNSANPTTFKEKDDVEIKEISLDGYIFDGWYDASTDGNKVTGWTKGTKTSDVTLWARWYGALQTISVAIPQYQDIEGLLSYNTVNKQFTALQGYKSYAWYIDSVLQSETTNTITIDANVLDAGWHSVTVEVTDNANHQFSAEYEIEVQKVR